ncbi:HAD family hydrolase [Gorillibacterium sp. sgz5001074]|uniref:HAD family hydrolase n=1 Tax=Gorillibacterium sp. sgz5001074 TaxID=3446695 RepID=UPI003F664802
MRKKSELDLVIFDMDGLMLDTESVSFYAWREAARGFGYEITMDLFRSTIGTNAAMTQAFYRSQFGETFPVEQVYEQRVRIAEEWIEQNGLNVKPGLFELLDTLKEAGIRRAVATSTHRTKAKRHLAAAGIAPYMEAMVCGDEVTRSKPDPDIFLKAASLLGCHPGRCLVLEDSEAGIRAASLAGMVSIMVPDLKQPDETTKALAFRLCSSLTEVKALLDGLE